MLNIHIGDKDKYPKMPMTKQNFYIVHSELGNIVTISVELRHDATGLLDDIDFIDVIDEALSIAYSKLR